MGLVDFLCPWKKGRVRENKNEPKTVNIFLGFFFTVNFCVGTGFLGIPYSFFYSGYLAAIPTLLFISVINWIFANYLLEVMARAQAVEYYDKLHDPSSDSDTDTELEEKKLTSTLLASPSSSSSMDASEYPKFEITTKRKFELAELCELFMNKWVKYAFLVCLSMYTFLAAWSFSTVAGSAWATNIPFNFGASRQCGTGAFQHNVLPTGGCLYAYYMSLTIFAVIVVTLSLFDLKEQAVIQLTLGILRFITVAIIVMYCIIRLVGGGDACRDQLETYNGTTPINIQLKTMLLSFDFKGWVVAIPVFTFAFLFHTGISSLTHPVKQKAHLHYLIISMFIASVILYGSLGIVVPLWFRAATQETCTLNWSVFTHPNNHIQLRILSYYIILFPSLDVISAYPLMNHVIVNNIYILITGHDTSIKPKYKFDFFLRKFLTFTLAILPIAAAFGVANLVYILKYAGLVGFICFLFPFLLQLRSIKVCKRKFSKVHVSHVSVSGSHSEKEHDSAGEEVKNKGEMSPSLEKTQDSLLLQKNLSKKDKRKLYMTPYSNILSHPVAVWIVGLLGLILFLFALSSLFVNPTRLSCYSLSD